MARGARARAGAPRGLSARKQADIAHRVAGMTIREILDWMDTVGSAMARAIMDYQQHRDLRSLDEISSGLYTLQLMVDKLEDDKLEEG